MAERTSGNTISINGQLYTDTRSPAQRAQASLAGKRFNFSNPSEEQLQGYLGSGALSAVGAPNVANNKPSFGFPPPGSFMPNQHAVNQLASFGSGRTVPQWMMDSYANKIGQMGGNANAPIPFGVTQGGFPGFSPRPSPQPQAQQGPRQMPSAGVSGKTGPYLNATQGIANGVQNVTRGLFK